MIEGPQENAQSEAASSEAGSRTTPVGPEAHVQDASEQPPVQDASEQPPVQDASEQPPPDAEAFVQPLRDLRDDALLRLEEQLREASLFDALTGLHNRRGFFLLAEQALRAAARHGRSLLLCLLDIDGLTEINEALGHDEGDHALVDVAERLTKVFRQSDLVARFDGDEFAVLAEADEDALPSLRQRLGDELDEHNASAGRAYFLAVSLGFAQYEPRRPVELCELLRQASRHLDEHSVRSEQARLFV